MMKTQDNWLMTNNLAPMAGTGSSFNKVAPINSKSPIKEKSVVTAAGDQGTLAMATIDD